jgi:hypothetical protein
LRRKWDSKPVDVLIGTKVHNGLVGNEKGQGFKEDQADYILFSNDGTFFEGSLKKVELAEKIMHMEL